MPNQPDPSFRLKVLVACESSGVVRNAFRNLGHDAWSCDLLPAEDQPTYHIQGDCLDAILDDPWDVIVAHPPCTHLCISGARWFEQKRQNCQQQDGIQFFEDLVEALMQSGARWAIENPIGIMGKRYRPADQIIQPYWFGDEVRKTTCLWLHNLPKLIATQVVDEGEFLILPDGRNMAAFSNNARNSPEAWKIRSRTFQGIANAMAEQWGGI